MTSSEAAAARRFPVGLTAAAVCALAVLVGLGAWQLHRLQWKAALLARIAALQAAPPEPLGPVLRRARDHLDLDFVRVQADCPDIERTPFLKLFSVRDGEAGYRVITACRLQGADFAAILVDRGFVAQEVAGRLTTADAPRLAGPVVGVLRTGDLGVIHENGHITLKGRKKEMIVTAYGKNISIPKIEELLKSIPGVSEAVLIGEHRPYCTALIWLETAAADLDAAIEEMNAGLSHPEQIRKYTIIPEPLSIQRGELTPNLKVKRANVEAHFRDEIEGMYR